MKLTLFIVLTIKLALLTVLTHQAYVVHAIYLYNLPCLQNRQSNLGCLQYWPSNFRCVQFLQSSFRWLRHGSIKLTWLTRWTNQSYVFTVWTYQYYVVNSMEPSILCCLQYGPINIMLFTVWTHQSYVVYSMVLLFFMSWYYLCNYICLVQLNIDKNALVQ